VTSSASEIRRRRVVLVLVLVAFVVAGVAAEDSSVAGKRAGLAAAVDPTFGLVPSPAVAVDPLFGLLPGGPAAPRSRRPRDARAIRRVLSYTPYVSSGGRRGRLIALTFDDGPGPYTRRIVRTLRRMRVRATFFQVGQMVSRYPRVARLVRRRFVVAGHTLSHPPLARLRWRAQRAEMAAGAARTHAIPGLFRPPYASFDRATLGLLRRQRVLMVLWSVDSLDYELPGRDVIVRRVVRAAHPGAIVLMHDAGGPRGQTAAALPAIVRQLRRRGYRFVTVPELLRKAPPPKRQKLPRGAGPH
jgi:peptidoglycan/xylan/chitin deacetylase (PgdA/CDA1 family)